MILEDIQIDVSNIDSYNNFDLNTNETLDTSGNSINGNLQLKKNYLTLQIMILEKLLLVMFQLIIKVKN